MKDINQVNITGTVSKGSALEYVTDSGSEKYKFIVETKRNSGVIDSIPVITIASDIKEGEQVCIEGTYASYNKIEDSKRKLKLHVFANCIEFTEWAEDNNTIVLEGTICKDPVFRITPFGKEIADILLAVNRSIPHKADYIPLIVWGANARKTQDLKIGDRIHIEGRIQSRIYNKDEIAHTAYEVSVNSLKILENNQI